MTFAPSVMPSTHRYTTPRTDLSLPRHSNHYYDGRIHHRKHHLGLVDEHVEPWRVQDIDFRFAPLHHGRGGFHPHPGGDFFLVPVRGRRALLDPPHSLPSSGCVQHVRYHRGFPCMAMSHHLSITKVFP